jgi:hypothetical protein
MLEAMLLLAPGVSEEDTKDGCCVGAKDGDGLGESDGKEDGNKEGKEERNPDGKEGDSDGKEEVGGNLEGAEEIDGWPKATFDGASERCDDISAEGPADGVTVGEEEITLLGALLGAEGPTEGVPVGDEELEGWPEPTSLGAWLLLALGVSEREGLEVMLGALLGALLRVLLGALLALGGSEGEELGTLVGSFILNLQF